MKTKIDDSLRNALVSLRIARDRLQKARTEKRRRIDISLDWMREDSKRTIGEANAYVGIDFASDEIVAARRQLAEAVDGVLHLGADIRQEEA